MRLFEDNTKLVEQFGAGRVADLEDIPASPVFQEDLVYSHRGFDSFYERLRGGEQSAIVSGVNASGTLHYGHRIVFDIVKHFQTEHDTWFYVPISDDESYVSGKVETQEEALENAYGIAADMLAYGFDPDKTMFVIDYKRPEIYNFAFKLSTYVTMNEVQSTYGYSMSSNPGLFFYPSVQSAHVLLPEHHRGITNTLVPIGPDEDSHLRIARDIAGRAGYTKPSVLHTRFLPGLDGKKMSTSKGNALFLRDTDDALRAKVNDALSGGKKTLEEHREHGGDPDSDMACQYLKTFFYDEEEVEELFGAYRDGSMLTGEVKDALFEAANEFNTSFVERAGTVSSEDVESRLIDL